MSEITIAILDTETTGLDPAKDKIVEFAAMRMTITEGDLGKSTLDGPTISFLVNPGIPIPARASAVHHLTAPDLETAFTPGVAVGIINDFTQGCAYLVAHNSAFDSKFVKSEIPWLCTFKLARHLVDTDQGYSNQTLRYALDLKPYLPPGLAPHRALYDVHTTAALFTVLLERAGSFQRLVSLNGAPIVLKKVSFGKHRDQLWSEVPVDYLRYLYRGMSVDPEADSDVLYTVKHWLKQRTQPALQSTR